MKKKLKIEKIEKKLKKNWSAKPSWGVTSLYISTSGLAEASYRGPL